MKLTTIALVFFFSGALAQQKVLEFPLPNANLHYTACVIPVEATNSFFMSVATAQSVERYLVHSSGTNFTFSQAVAKENLNATAYTISPRIYKLYKSGIFIAGGIFKKEVIDVIQHPAAKKYFFVSTDFNSGISTITDTLPYQPNEELIHSYFTGKKLVLIKRHRTREVLIFHSKTPGSKIKTDTVSINPFQSTTPGHQLAGDRAKYPATQKLKNKIVFMPYNMWYPLGTINFTNRAFVKDNKFIATFNTPDLSSWILTMNLETFAYEVEEYKLSKPAKDANTASHTSILFDSVLITGTVTENDLDLHIFNVANKKLIAHHVINENNFSSFSPAPVEQVGDFWSRSNSSTIGFKDFLKKCLSNQVLISGRKDQNSISLTIGSEYRPTIDATFVGNVMTLGMLGFNQVKPPPTVSFNMGFELPDLSATKKEVKNFIWDKMLIYLFGHRHVFPNFTFFYMNGFYYIGNADMNGTKFQVYKFSEKAANGN